MSNLILLKASQKKMKKLDFCPLAPYFYAGVAACCVVTIKLRAPLV